MATENPVYRVLATLGNQAPLAVGAKVDTLANGQIGVFNYHSNLAIDGNTPADNEDIYIAVGINRTSGGTATAEDISKSAGQLIQTENGAAFTLKGYVDAIQQIWDITLPKAYCQTDYIIKLQFDSTGLSTLRGYTQNSKSFSYYEENCTSDTDDTILPSKVILALRDIINADSEKTVTAYVIEGGTTTVLADQAAIDTYLALNTANRVRLRIVGNVEPRPSNGDVYIKYYKSNRSFNVVLMDGFIPAGGAATEARKLQVQEGSGYDIKKLENFAAGWGKPGPYRTGAVTGLPNSVEAFVTSGTNYNFISLKYDQYSVGGWLEYRNNLETNIAIPCADATTLTGLIGILTKVFPQFGSMVNDAATMDCTNTNISTINDIALDGIETVTS